MNGQELDNMKHEQVKDNDVDEWKGNYDTFNQLPESWKQNVMIKSSGIPSAVMAKVAEKDSSMVDVLFEFELQMKKETKFPLDCHDVGVCSKTCTKRAQTKGMRLFVAYKSGMIKEDGSVDYGKLCFEPKLNDAGVVTEMHHISGQKAKIPAHMQMNTDFVMCDNHLDFEAKMVLQQAGAFASCTLCFYVLVGVLGVVLFCVCVCEGVGRDMHVPSVAHVKHFLTDLFLGLKHIHEDVIKSRKGTEIADIAHGIAQEVANTKFELDNSAVSAEVSVELKDVQSARGNKRIASARSKLAARKEERESKRRVQL